VFLGEGNLGYVVRLVLAPFRTPIDRDLLIVILIFGNRDFGSSNVASLHQPVAGKVSQLPRSELQYWMK
jgi:hypothetical protein